MNAELDRKTRHRIVCMLRTLGPLHAFDIARRLGISSIAVRRHLNNLERDRYVRYEPVRGAAGRPAFMYYLTEQAEELFPKNYADMTLELLEDVRDLLGEAAVAAFFERREGRLAAKYEERLGASGAADDGEAGGLEERVARLASIQDDRGYMAEWRREDDALGPRFLLTEHNCPIHAVAHRFNQACSSELSLFRKVLNARVEQLECKAKGGQRCIYEIRPQK